MAHGHYQKLDDEERALHDSWQRVLRMVLGVMGLSVVVWAAATVLRLAVHTALEHLFHTAVSASWGLWALMAALVGGGVVRGLLLRRPAWADAAGDGMSVALRNYHVTYEHSGDDPQPRYALPDLGLSLRKGVMTLLTLGRPPGRPVRRETAQPEGQVPLFQRHGPGPRAQTGLLLERGDGHLGHGRGRLHRRLLRGLSAADSAQPGRLRARVQPVRARRRNLGRAAVAWP